jgi:hypothetical protein
MIDVAILEVRAFANPFVQGERRTLGSFGVEIGGVTVRRCFLVEDRGRRFVRSPGCQHADAEIRFSPALNRYLTRVVGREIAHRTKAPDGISEAYVLADEAAPGACQALPSPTTGPALVTNPNAFPVFPRAREDAAISTRNPQ